MPGMLVCISDTVQVGWYLIIIDRTGGRFFHQSAWWWGVMVGFIISLATNNNGARYFSMFLMACGYGGEYIVSGMHAGLYIQL